MLQDVITQPDTLQYILELGGHVGDMVVAAVAIIALFQIFYAKRQLKLAADALDTARSDIEIRVRPVKDMEHR